MNNFSIDHYFSIGSTHNVCQDYSVSGVEDNTLYYGIISDGCSTAKDTDIGSRILCKLTEQFIKTEYNHQKDIESNYNNLKKYILKSINNFSLTLDIENYFATLLLFISDKNKTNIFVFGDGYINIKYLDKQVIRGFRYTQNAPAYIAYDLNKENKNTYLKTFKQVLEIDNLEIINGNTNSQTSIRNVEQPIFYTFGNKDIEAISIMSDGIDSFNKDSFSIVKELTEYKNINGNFVIRKTKAFLRNCQKNDLHNKDDLSIASIFFNKEELYE